MARCVSTWDYCDGFAEYYAFQNTGATGGDYPGNIPLGFPIPFARVYLENGGITTSPPYVVSTANPAGTIPDTFLLPNIGIYKVQYALHFGQPSQVAIYYQAGGTGAFVLLEHAGSETTADARYFDSDFINNTVPRSRIRLISSTSTTIAPLGIVVKSTVGYGTIRSPFKLFITQIK